MALEGGCRWIQLRMKDVEDELFIRTALEIIPLCRKHNATFIVDDRVHLVRELKADGVHLGKLDMPVGEARKMLGTDFIIGGTANTFQDVANHYSNGADYIGCGPFRFTSTKKNLSPVLGAEGYSSILSQMKAQRINIPLVAIGGILYDDIIDLMQTGISGVALSGAVLQASDPEQEMKRLVELTNSI